MIKSIDHILVSVKDLEKAVRDYSLVFGFGPTWQGNHPSLGTKNALFPLENMYSVSYTHLTLPTNREV